MMLTLKQRWPALLLTVLLAACSSDETLPPNRLKPLPVHPAWIGQQWSQSVGDGADGEFLHLRPAIGETAVFAASRDGVVVAVDKQSGKRLWRRKTGYPITGGLSTGYGMVLAGTAKGELLVLSASTGATLWRADLSAAVLSAPAIDADRIIVQCADGKVYALDRDKGTRLWTHDTVVPVLSLRGNAAPLLVNGTVYVATAGGKVESLQAADGAPQWELRVASNQGRSELERMTDIDGDMLLDDVSNTLFAVGFQSQLGAVDVTEGHRLWEYDVSSYQGLAAVAGNVYVSDAAGTLYGVDASTGKAAWKQADLSGRGLSAPVPFAGNLLVGDSEGYVHLVAPADGSLLGRVSAGSSAILAMYADSSTVYIYTADGKLSGWRPASDGPQPKRLGKTGYNGWN
jgi:outer membrane protein assembly factor BamB